MAEQTPAEKAKAEAEDKARKDAAAKAEADAKADAAAEKAKAEAAKAAEKKPAERSAKAADALATSSDPHPTQAELDAMKEGRLNHGREVKADGKSVDYKTR